METITAYQAGYSTALQDVLEYLQSSLDVNVAQQRSNEGIAQVIDYIEVSIVLAIKQSFPCMKLNKVVDSFCTTGKTGSSETRVARFRS